MTMTADGQVPESGDDQSASATPGEHLLAIEADPSGLGEARDFVRPMLNGRDADSDTLFLIAFTEVVVNAIDAHAAAGSNESIVIWIDTADRVIEVADRGAGFDPAKRTVADVDATNGRGLDIISALVPEAMWRPNAPQGTVCVLPYGG